MAAARVVWRHTSAQRIDLDVDAVRLEITQITRDRDGVGSFRMTPVGDVGPFLAAAATDLGTTSGTASPRPSPDAVEGGIVLFELVPGAKVSSKLCIETPEMVEVYLEVRDGKATFACKEDDGVRAMDVLCRGLRDGAAWSPGVANAAAPMLDREGVLALLARNDDRSWDMLTDWIEREPETARSLVRSVRAAIDQARRGRPSDTRWLLLTNGRAYLQRVQDESIGAELALQLADRDDRVRHDARYFLDRALDRKTALPQAQLTRALDRWVSKLAAPKRELEEAIRLRERLARPAS